MNVKETIEYLNHRSEYDRMVENYFVVYDQSLVASSPLLAFMERIAPYWWRRELAVVDEKDLALLIEAKTHLSDNPYILAYLEFLIGCKTNDFRPFANALDRSLDAYCGGAKTFRDESNLFFLIGHTKMIGRDVDTHILSLLVQRIGHPKVSRSDISLINRVIHFFGPIKIRSIKTFGKFLSEITDGEKKELDETVAMCRLIRNWMSLYSNDAKIAKKKFIDLVLNNLVPMPDQSFQKTLQLCEDYVCETNYRKVMLPLLGAEIEKAGKEMLTKMQSVDISLPPDLEEKIKESNKKHKDFLAKLTNRDKLLWFTENLPIFARQEMIDQAKKQKENDCWGQFCESQILDKDGRIVNYKERTLEQQESMDMEEPFELALIAVEWTFRPLFEQTFEFDDETRQFLTAFAKRNALLDAGWQQTFVDLFARFSKGEYTSVFFRAAPMLEQGLRHYLKNKGHYVKKSDGKRFISFNDIFSTEKSGGNKTNEYRDELLKTIDEDYCNLLHWLLVDEYGMGIRNQFLHGLQNPGESDLRSFYACFLIFRLYFGFDKGDPDAGLLPSGFYYSDLKKSD